MDQANSIAVSCVIHNSRPDPVGTVGTDRTTRSAGGILRNITHATKASTDVFLEETGKQLTRTRNICIKSCNFRLLTPQSLVTYYPGYFSSYIHNASFCLSLPVNPEKVIQ
jgi:hypothetical protein